VGWLRRSAARPRHRPSSADPVAAALAEAATVGPLVPRFDDLEPAREELPTWFSVADDTSLDGFDTLVSFEDEIRTYCDPADDGLEAALAEQPGISAVFAEDREVVYLATRLHLDDVAAAVIRAVVDVNRTPRPASAAPGEVTDEQAAAVADAVAPLITAAGFRQRADGRYFHRDCGHGVVQVLFVSRGLGELTDGTSLHDRIWLFHGVCLPEAQPHPMPDDPARVAPMSATLSSSTHPAPDPAAVAEALRTTALPWLEGTAGRDALAAWAADDPERIFPPAQRPLLARLFTEWGHATAARTILDHLDRKWPSLARERDARAAREALDRM
jgi:hypothetical protein